MKDTIIEQLHHLDKEKKKMGSTVVALESYHSYENNLPKLKGHSQITPIDLEMAVLVQELMSVREEKFDLQERYLKLQKQYLSVKEQLSDSKEKSKIDFNKIQELERQLKEGNFVCVEGINVKLKNQLKEVTSALQLITKNSDARQKQNNSFIEKLKIENRYFFFFLALFKIKILKILQHT